MAHRRKQHREAVPMAMLIQVLVNVHRDSEQRPQPFELSEVLQWLGFAPEPEAPQPEPPKPSMEELLERTKMLHQVYTQNGQSQEGT